MTKTPFFRWSYFLANFFQIIFFQDARFCPNLDKMTNLIHWKKILKKICRVFTDLKINISEVQILNFWGFFSILENVFFLEKWFFWELKNWASRWPTKYMKMLTPGRYPVQKICPPKKTASDSLNNQWASFSIFWTSGKPARKLTAYFL